MKIGDYLDSKQVEDVIKRYMIIHNQTRKEAQDMLKTYFTDVLGEEYDNSF